MHPFFQVRPCPVFSSMLHKILFSNAAGITENFLRVSKTISCSTFFLLGGGGGGCITGSSKIVKSLTRAIRPWVNGS